MTSPTEHSKSNPAISAALPFLQEAVRRLEGILQDDVMGTEVPVEVEAEIDLANRAITKAVHRLEAEVRRSQPTAHAPAGQRAVPPPAPRAPLGPARPTRQQGQFLAFLQAFMQHNYAGVAPTHAEFQKFFNLTPPSVNSMLKRLEQLGFIRRVPGKARAIELIIDPDLIPPLERPFKF